jgi:hypothetical protein
MEWKAQTRISVYLLLHALAWSVCGAEPLPAKEIISDSQIADRIFERARAFRPTKTPLLCDVGFDIPHVHIVQIDEAKETYTIDFYSWVQWTDNRLSFKPEEFGIDAKQAENVFINIDPKVAWKHDRMWDPHIEFINVVETKVATRNLRLQSDGLCAYIVRQTGIFKFAGESHTFRQFPFDTQKLPITVGSFVWNAAQLQFKLDDDTEKSKKAAERPKVRPAAEWEFVNFDTEVSQETYTGEPVPFSELSIIFNLKRHAGFYLWRVCLPLFILVAIAMAIPWLPAHNAEARMILSVTTLVAVTTFSIVVNAALPRLPYLTFLDGWMLVGFSVTALGALENVAVANSAHRKNKQRAEQIDLACQWLMPLLYIGGTLLCALIYGLFCIAAILFVVACIVLVGIRLFRVPLTAFVTGKK